MKLATRIPRLLLCLLFCITLCSCGQSNRVEGNIEEIEENIKRTREQYEEKYTCSLLEMYQNDQHGRSRKTEYTAEKDGSKILGYPATIHLQCHEDISGQDLANIASFELADFIVSGYSDVAECIAKTTLATKEKQEILLRFSDKSRRTVAVYLDGKPKKTADYYVDINLPEDLLLYTNTAAQSCEYTLPDTGEKLEGMSAVEEITLLRELDDDGLEEFLQRFIKMQQDTEDESLDKKYYRIEYQFEIYQFGEKRASIVMRSVNKDMDKWEIVKK